MNLLWLTVAIQTLVPYTDNGILLTPVAVHTGVNGERLRDACPLLCLLAGLVVCVFVTRCFDREENVVDVVGLACLGAGGTLITQVVV